MSFFDDPWAATPTPPPRRGSRALWWLAAATVGTVVATGFVFANAEGIQDAIARLTFTPTPEVAQLGDALELTPDGQALWTASRPVLVDGGELAARCGSSESDEFNLLGCYADSQIVVFDIAEPRLEPVELVTAAHELLHGAWQRMDATERDAVGALVDRAYERLERNPELRTRLRWYAATEPGQRRNELHSILATEFDDLPSALEAHYARWFTDRGAIVAANDRTNGVIERLDERAGILDRRIRELDDEITARRAAYDEALARYEADVQSLQARVDAGEITSQSQFDVERQQLEQRADELDAERTAITALNDRAIELSERLQGLYERAVGLSEALDSNA